MPTCHRFTIYFCWNFGEENVSLWTMRNMLKSCLQIFRWNVYHFSINALLIHSIVLHSFKNIIALDTVFTHYQFLSMYFLNFLKSSARWEYDHKICFWGKIKLSWCKYQYFINDLPAFPYFFFSFLRLCYKLNFVGYWNATYV